MAESAAEVSVGTEQTGPAPEVVGTEEPSTGDTLGPKSLYVRLVFSDGHEFVVKRKSVLILGIMKVMLCGPGMWC